MKIYGHVIAEGTEAKNASRGTCGGGGDEGGGGGGGRSGLDVISEALPVHADKKCVCSLVSNINKKSKAIAGRPIGL
jgi:hypothetical protein